MNPLITLAQIRAQHPCESGWRKVLAAYGPDLDTAISLGDIAASNGAEDALWCVQCLDWSDVAVRRAVIRAIMPGVRRAAVHTDDARVGDCIAAIDRWLAGDDAVELAAAWDAARDAARAAARAAAWVAAWVAAWDAAWVAAWDAAWADLIAAFPPVRAAIPAAA